MFQDGRVENKPHLGRQDFPGSRSHSVWLGFLNIQLQAARTFAALATRPCNATLKTGYLREARTAYETVSYFFYRVPLPQTFRQGVEKELARVKLELEFLGEDFDNAMNAPNNRLDLFAQRVQTHLALNKRLRAVARDMLTQNREMMRKFEIAKNVPRFPYRSAGARSGSESSSRACELAHAPLVETP
jgi:hypothetical protein